MNSLLAKLVVASFILVVLSVTYFSARWAFSKSLKQAYPTQAERENCKKKEKDLIWVHSKQAVYYAVAILSVLAYLLPWDFVSRYCMIFTAIISFMEAKDYDKTVTDTNSKLSRALKK